MTKPRPAIRYLLHPAVPLPDAHEVLLLAVLAVAAIHGETAMRVDGEFRFLPQERRFEIDVGNAVGQHLARVLAGFLLSEFGHEAIQIEREGASS